MWLPYEATPPYERWPARDVDPKGPAACSIGGLRIVLASLRLVAVAGSLSVMPIFEAPQSTLAWGHFSSMGRRHEPPRHVRRLQFLERMGSCQVVHRGGTRRSCV
ncbi:hypothetical protein, partial [Mycobacterium tuberculosis]